MPTYGPGGIKVSDAELFDLEEWLNTQPGRHIEVATAVLKRYALLQGEIENLEQELAESGFEIDGLLEERGKARRAHAEAIVLARQLFDGSAPIDSVVPIAPDAIKECLTHHELQVITYGLPPTPSPEKTP